MTLTHRIALVLLALIIPAAVLAQGSSPLVTVAPIPTVVVTRGGKAPLTIALRLNKGFHVNSHKPSDEFLVPTVVHLLPPQGISIVGISYPEGEELSVPFLNEKLNVYSGDFMVTAEIHVPKSAMLGSLRVHGDVKYQACDNRQCFPPKTTPLEFDVKVVRPKAKKSTFTPASPHVQ